MREQNSENNIELFFLADNHFGKDEAILNDTLLRCLATPQIPTNQEPVSIELSQQVLEFERSLQEIPTNQKPVVIVHKNRS